MRSETSVRYLSLVLAGLALPASLDAQIVRVRNNHSVPYRGPVEVKTSLADGQYAGPNASGVVRGGTARVMVDLPAGGQVVLARGAGVTQASAGALTLVPSAQGTLVASWRGRALSSLDLALVVAEGTTATIDMIGANAVPLTSWQQDGDALVGRGTARGIAATVTLRVAPDGYVDATTTVVRESGEAVPAYVAVVREVKTPGTAGAKLRFNGRVFDAGSSPDTWDRDFWYVRGLDWQSWTANGLSVVMVNGFTPAPTIKKGKKWAEGSHFYVWERSRAIDGGFRFVSEIAGPNEEQAKSRYMPVTEYAPLATGDTVSLRWRLAVGENAPPTFADAQLKGFAGYRLASTAKDTTTIDIGTPHVTFGTAYFPYSTFAENLDFYRTPGLDRETWWPISAEQWTKWRDYVPRMQTDLRIIRALGFDAVRLHHLELLQQMKREDALAWLDWFTGELRALNLSLMIDSEGPVEWMETVTKRYADVIDRVEIENEILIGGVTDASPARWTALYQATKRADPTVQSFLTTAGNHGQFERLRQLGVPFDRVGLHAYKHGPQWKEAYNSHVLGTADYASTLGKPVTLGEFNWKELTKLSPEDRVPHVAEVWRQMFEPRAIPEVMQFHLHETLTFNPAIAGGFTRHYEPLGLDRRPKLEAAGMVKTMREYERADAPTRILPITVREATVVGAGSAKREATATFTIRNNTGRTLSLRVTSVAFDGTVARLLSPSTVTLEAGDSHDGRVALSLTATAKPGLYHHFVKATASDFSAYGWGLVNNPGAPTFAAAPVLDDRVTYAQGAAVVSTLEWRKPLYVTYGEQASVVELETGFTLANTLQAATGRVVRLSMEQDLPDSLARTGLTFAIGTPASSARIRAAGVTADSAKGVVDLRTNGGGQLVLLAGSTKDGAQAAAIDLVLRFWPNAKDAAMGRTGKEKGNALGFRKTVTNPDPP